MLRLALRLFACLSCVAWASTLHAAAPPPIPSTSAREKAHPASIPLWDGVAPGSEAKANVTESVEWRQEPVGVPTEKIGDSTGKLDALFRRA